MERLAIFFVVEPGYLEEQARLLVRSIRRFAGPFTTAPLWAVSPRPAMGPLSPETMICLDEYDVRHAAEPINVGAMKDYPLANKPLAGAWLEERLAGAARTLVFLDTDTVVLRPPEVLCLDGDEKVAVRPAHFCREVGPRADAPPNAYWSELYRLCGVADPDAHPMATTMDRAAVRCHVNSGVVAVDPRAGIFGAWARNMVRVFDAGFQDRAEWTVRQRRLVEQSCLSATILATCRPGEVGILPAAANYFVPAHRALPADVRLERLDDAVVAHYHLAFYNAALVRSLPMSRELRAWMDGELPLRDRRQPLRRRLAQRWARLRGRLGI